MDEKQLQADIDALVRERHENIDTLTRPESAALAQQIKAKRAELQALLSDGADPCARCARVPLVIRQQKGGYPYYEIGCVVDHYEQQQNEQGQMVEVKLPTNRVKNPRHQQREDAIAAWNELQAEIG